jgi:hypothetical protein
MARAKKKSCHFKHCDREATHSRKTLCHRCYHRLLDQTKKGPTWLMARINTLDLWSEGLEELLGVASASKARRKQIGKYKKRQAKRRAA